MNNYTDNKPQDPRKGHLKEGTMAKLIPDDALMDGKIFPRNLTARAAYIVPGNPVVTRPEDSISNCFPGLEIDIKNLQKTFFPDLYFEVYEDLGARLRGVKPRKDGQPWLSSQDLKDFDKEGIYIWAMKGRTKKEETSANPPSIAFPSDRLPVKQFTGLYVWRQIDALFKGKVGVAVAPKPSVAGPALDQVVKEMEAAWVAGKNKVKRDGNGKLEWAVLVDNRVNYLNSEGVLDPDLYNPGDLTRTLCTPWTYDFRDCQCFYWASNKPDVITSENGQYEYLNFQRKSRNIEPQTQDTAYDYQGRRQQEIDYAPMMMDWQQLRPVANGREFGETYKVPEGPKGRKDYTLKEIIQELTYAATLEHALAVQYLYGFYSVDVPWEEPDKETDVKQFRLWKGAQEIFHIAVDEMRHFRWANEALKLLNAPVNLNRATKLGRVLNIDFFLQSLSSIQLQWFIDVERPSTSVNEGLDGMYVHILRSLQHLPDSAGISPENRQRAIEIVKLIIDEGEGHYVRFSTAQQNFAFYDDAARGYLPKYIRGGKWSVAGASGSDPNVPNQSIYGAPSLETPGTEVGNQQLTSDRYYHLLLYALKISFSIKNDIIAGQALSKAIGLMFKMNKANFNLAHMEATPLFTLPVGWEQDPPVKTGTDVQRLVDSMKGILQHLGVKPPTWDEVPAEESALYSASQEAEDQASETPRSSTSLKQSAGKAAEGAPAREGGPHGALSEWDLVNYFEGLGDKWKDINR